MPSALTLEVSAKTLTSKILSLATSSSTEGVADSLGRTTPEQRLEIYRLLKEHSKMISEGLASGSISPRQIADIQQLKSFIQKEHNNAKIDARITEVAASLRAEGFDVPALVAVVAHGLLKSGAKAFQGAHSISRVGLVDICKNKVSSDRANEIIDQLKKIGVITSRGSSSDEGLSLASTLSERISAPVRSFIDICQNHKERLEAVIKLGPVSKESLPRTASNLSVARPACLDKLEFLSASRGSRISIVGASVVKEILEDVTRTSIKKDEALKVVQDIARLATHRLDASAQVNLHGIIKSTLISIFERQPGLMKDLPYNSRNNPNLYYPAVLGAVADWAEHACQENRDRALITSAARTLMNACTDLRDDKIRPALENKIQVLCSKSRLFEQIHSELKRESSAA